MYTFERIWYCGCSAAKDRIFVAQCVIPPILPVLVILCVNGNGRQAYDGRVAPTWPVGFLQALAFHTGKVVLASQR
jgi:hypothetical protein